MTIPADHRVYPPPKAPWVMHQSWHDLLFAHWPIEPAVMRERVPECMELDTFDGSAWIGVVPFHMSNVRPRFVPPIPGFSCFPELNVRTYVINNGKPGVYFFSLDATNSAAVYLARTTYQLPYFRAEMSLHFEGDTIHYKSIRRGDSAQPAGFLGSYAPTGPVQLALPGSIDYWFTERYCLYATNLRGELMICEIHHPQWPLQPAMASIQENIMAAAAGLILPDTPPLLHFSKRLDVRIWPLCRCKC